MTVRATVADVYTPPGETKFYALGDLASLEVALSNGLTEQWRDLVARDPMASLLQTPGWCVPWYRCYQSTHDPYVIVVEADSRPVGLVPMAVERETREFAFAGNTMADYRDIVALPGYRAAVVGGLIDAYLAAGFANPLEVGWIDAISDTPGLIADACRSRGLPYIVRHQPCWRWFPPPPEKPSAHKFLNWYKRQGTVTFEVIETEAAWQTFREEYYRQHSLRQIQAGRQVSFEDPRKAALYEEMFHSPEVRTHVTGFYVNGKMLAGHFGHVWRDVLMLGPPSIRLEDEQRSPAVILLAWIIQNAADLGLAGFDMTIGDSDFKKRLGNQCVQLTAIDIYANKRSYYARAARKKILSQVKKAIGEDTWKTKVKPAGARLSHKLQCAAEMGGSAAVGAAFRAAVGMVYEERSEVTYSAAADSLRPTTVEFGETHENHIEDLLLWQGTSPSVSAALTGCARSFSRIRNAKHSVHTLVSDGALGGWCFSNIAEAREAEGATGPAYEPGSALVYGVYALPGFRKSEAYQALIGQVAHGRVAAGAPRVYMTVPADDAAQRSAVEALGFRATAETRYKRLLRSSSSKLIEHPSGTA